MLICAAEDSCIRQLWHLCMGLCALRGKEGVTGRTKREGRTEQKSKKALVFSHRMSIKYYSDV